MDRDEETPKKLHSSAPTPTRTPTHDESITTSTESDTFETWTLVKDKNKKSAATTTTRKPKTATTTERTETLKEAKFTATDDDEDDDNEHEQVEQQIGSKPEVDSSVDELSDGISIISESESGGRISPHPYLRDHLINLNLKFSTGDPDLPQPSSSSNNNNSAALSALDSNSFEEASSGSQLRQRRQKRSRSRSTSTNNVCTSLQTAAPGASGAGVLANLQLPAVVRRGLSGLFYIGVALALVGFIGKLGYPEWEPLGASKPIAELAQKMIDMELQNNLMRAEIDLLSKQMNYLNNLNERKFSSGKAPYNVPTPVGKEDVPYKKRDLPDDTQLKGKMFKAWLGNGKLLEPVVITKGDLKRPYRCRDGGFVEVAGMCVENRPNEKSLLDEVGGAVNDVLQQNEAFQVFEKVAEKLQTFNENPFDDGEQVKVPPLVDTLAQKPPNTQQEQQQQRREFKHSAERSDGSAGHSKERMQQQQRFREHKGDFNDDSRERYTKRTFSSKESNYNKKREGNSKEERYATERHSHKSHHNHHSGERNYKDGHWHEKRMQNREDARRQNDQWQQQQQQRHGKNWYIKRGDSREQLRHDDNREQPRHVDSQERR